MTTYEKEGKLTYKDEVGDKHLLYPKTKIHCVDGLETALASHDSHSNNKANPHGVTAAQIGLGNVNNTADADKPVSTAQATAIADAKKAGTDAQTMANNARTEAIEAARFAQTCINDHTANRTNPHGVTAAQIGAITAEQVTTMINEALGVIENGTY